MRSIYAALAFVALAAGCNFHRQDHYTYCDDSQCYSCDSTGCQPQQGGNGGWGNTCAANTDCAQGYFCDPGSATCYPSITCATSPDCGPGMTCDSRNTCIPGPLDCTTQADCAAGCYCQNGTCNESGLCSQDDDCAQYGAGFVCVANTCMPPSTSCTAIGDCATGQDCVNGTCQASGVAGQGCTTNAQCGTGECVSGSCYAACTAGQSCGTGEVCGADGFCAPTGGTPDGGTTTGDGGTTGGDGGTTTSGCVLNTDCASGNVCINSVCHAGCAEDSDCTTAGDTCLAGACRPTTGVIAQCHSNTDCATGLECVNAICSAACYSDSDCSACGSGGTSCSSGYCQ